MNDVAIRGIIKIKNNKTENVSPPRNCIHRSKTFENRATKAPDYLLE